MLVGDSLFNSNELLSMRVLPSSEVTILPIGSVKVSNTDLHRNLSCSNPDTARQSGSEVRLVVSTFISLIQYAYINRLSTDG